MIYGILFAPTSSVWSMTAAVFDGAVDFQSPVRNANELRLNIRRDIINTARTEIVIAFDHTPRDPASKDGRSTLLAHTLGKFLHPDETTRNATPVVIVETEQRLTASLRQEILASLQTRGIHNPEEIVDRIVVSPAKQGALIAAVEYATGRSLNSDDVPLVIHSAPDRDPHTGSIVSVIGSKGGIGRTTTSHALAFTAAHAARQEGFDFNVVVIEWDIDRAKTSSIVGLDGKFPYPDMLTFHSMGEVTEEAITSCLVPANCIDDYGTRHLPSGAMRFLLGPHDALQAGSLGPEFIRSVARLIAGIPTVDLVVIDCGPAVIGKPEIAEAVKASDHVVYVADRDPQSLADIDESVEWLEKVAGLDIANLHLVINRCSADIQDEMLLESIAAQTQIPPSLTVPVSPAIAAAMDRGATTNRFLRTLDDERSRPEDWSAHKAYRSLIRHSLRMPKPTRRLS